MSRPLPEVDRRGLGGLEVGLEIEVVARVVGAGHDGLVAHVRVTEGPVVVLTAAGDGEVGGEGAARAAEDGIDPVVGGDVLVQVDVAETAEIRLVVVVDVAAEGSELILELDEILGVHHLDGIPVRHGLEAVVGVELDGDLLAFFRALGGHDDDAVRTAGTVDRRGEGILQDVDRLDLGGRDVVDGFHREAVHDVERGAVLGDGTAAADADLDVGVRVAFRRDDGDTGHLAGKGLADRVHGLFGELVGIHRGDGAEEVAALDGRITDDDDLVEEGAVLLQDDVDLGTALDRDGLVRQSDEGEYQVHGVVRNGQLVVTVDAGDRTHGRAFHEDAGSDERFTLLVRDDTFDGRLGGEGPRRSEAEQREHEFLCWIFHK